MKETLDFWINQIGVSLTSIADGAKVNRDSLYRYTTGKSKKLDNVTIKALNNYFSELQNKIILWKPVATLSQPQLL